MSEEEFKELYKNVKKEEIIQELCCKCNANKELNNIIKNYEINTIPTLEHNIDVLVDSEDRLNNIINELEKWLLLEISIHCEDDIIDTLYSGVLNKLKELKENKIC